MIIITNINIKQKLPSPSSNTKNPNITPNHPNFGEKVYISNNGTPIKTFANHPFFSIDLTIFFEAKLQFNVPTVKINYLITFKPKISHNISLYKQDSNIPTKNIPTYIYCDMVIDPNKNESIYVVNLESNFYTTSLFFTSPVDLLLLSLEEIKRIKTNVLKTRGILYAH
jgi:hypothetical protein